MFEEIVEAVKESVKTQVVTVRDKEYITDHVYLPPAEPTVSPLKVDSLAGLTDYLNQKVDSLDSTKLLIHIDDAKHVFLFEQVADKEGERHLWIRADAGLKEFPFSQYMGQEQFITSFQSLFINEGDFELVLEYVSNISSSEELENTDDGVSQSVILQKGIQRKTVAIKNPVNLSPIRTFTELKQPSSPFILRMKKQGESVVTALIEADNGKWENEARKLIKEYLKENLTVQIPILA